MSDEPIIRNKPVSAYRFAIVLTQDHNGEIEVEQFPGANTPTIEQIGRLLANATETIRQQILLAGITQYIGQIKSKAESDKVQLLQLQLKNEQKQVKELINKNKELVNKQLEANKIRTDWEVDHDVLKALDGAPPPPPEPPPNGDKTTRPVSGSPSCTCQYDLTNARSAPNPTCPVHK